ncbi:XRE family transcriptional regulator [Lactobacillus delbrueckii subsp. bulgaricus]|uniref:helix-turn-helix transcriptional regulator n=1 Tax=Lactobacillus delbrueckii TaxID=1584 RepID=UPI0021A875CB|nr:helix-turn-helix transcriptional regulator [Lactobacillus delbrueckii]MCT3465878.1 XRE family transcriptional regulator [Lactobacillus delbrueckii subsp. bulgaricus]MCT3470841.1 XRE family transcriptional regulator [Lactobacillus delbrueckii subsp. bulgaricus]
MNELTELRKAHNLSQKELAEKLGLSQPMIAMMEAGERRGSDATKLKVAKFFGKTVDELFFTKNNHLK